MEAHGTSTSSVNTRTERCQTSGSINPLLLDESPGWYSTAKQEDARTRRVKQMKQMLSAGKVISLI